MEEINKTNRIIQEIKAGKKESLNEFYLSARKKFMSWAKKSFSFSEAERLDLYQQSMLLLYENILNDKLTTLNNNLESYLYGLAKNLALKSFRKENIRMNHEAKLSEHLQSHYFEEDESFITMKTLVKKLIPELKEGCQQILKWFYFDNKSLDEIVDMADYKNKDVVKAQKSRCIQYLKDKLKESLKNINY